MKTLQQVTLRNGRIAWIEPNDGRSVTVWRYVGGIVKDGGKTEEPHTWTAAGCWVASGAEHENDIVDGLAAAQDAFAKMEESAR